MFGSNPHPQLFGTNANLFVQPQQPRSAITWGLCKSGSGDLLPLENIDVSVDIINNVATVFYDKTYFNNSDQFIETDYYFPISLDACFDSFQAKFGEVTITGVIKKKQEAKQDYQNAIQQGRTAAISEIVSSGNDAMRLKIGNIPPQTNIIIKYSYIQKLEVALNKFWCFQLFSSATSGPSYDWRTLLNPSLPVVFGKNTENCLFNVKVNIQSSSPISSVKSPSHEIVQTFGNENHTCTIQLDQKKLNLLGKDFILLFSNGNENQMNYILTLFEDGYCAMVNFVADFDAEISPNEAYDSLIQAKEPAKTQHSMSTIRGEYIFLIDRSGSMSGGKMHRAKNSLILFLKSLPTDCFFNVIGFGSQFQVMYPESVEYSEESIESSLQKIENLEANMGGTNIYHPLKKVYETPLKKGFPRFIFLLTDGEVDNTYEVLNLIKENVNAARVFSIGIGSDCSQNLITQSAINGRGKHEFVVESQEIPSKVISLLNASLSPCYFDISLNSTNFDAVVKSITPNPNDVAFLLNGQVLTFFLLLRKEAFEYKKMGLSLRLYDSTKKDYRSVDLTLDQENSLDHPQVCKLAIHEMIRALEDQKRGIGQGKSNVLWNEKADIEASLTELSLKYQILCKETAFFLEFIGDQSPKADEMEIENRGNVAIRLLPGYIVPQSQIVINAPSFFSGFGNTNAIQNNVPSSYNPNTFINPANSFGSAPQNFSGGFGGSTNYSASHNNNNVSRGASGIFSGGHHGAPGSGHSSGCLCRPAQQQQASSGGLFGNSQQRQASSGGLFGNSQQQQVPSGGLFGNKQTHSHTSGGLFGNAPQTQSQVSSGGLFGNSQQQQVPSGVLFAKAPQTQSQASSGGLFGNSQQTQHQASSGGGLFGSMGGSAPQNGSYGPYVGSQQQMGMGGPLPGNTPQNQTSGGGGLFGNTGNTGGMGSTGGSAPQTGSYESYAGAQQQMSQQQEQEVLRQQQIERQKIAQAQEQHQRLKIAQQQQQQQQMSYQQMSSPQQMSQQMGMGGSLSGNASQNQASSGGLFGNIRDMGGMGSMGGSTQQTSSLGYSPSTQQTQQTGGSLFGNIKQNHASGGLFGNAPQSQASSGGLFGSTGGSTRQTLGASSNTQQTQHIQQNQHSQLSQQTQLAQYAQQKQQTAPSHKISYMDVVMEQKILGYWDGANQKLISMICEDRGFPQVPEELKQKFSEDLVLKIWMTVLVLRWLEKAWSSERNAWALVHQKGCEWLKGQGINYEEVKNLGN